MKLPCMVREVYTKFGWVSLSVRGETLLAKGVLADGDEVRTLCHTMVNGRPALNITGDDFETKEVVFPRSEFIAKNEAGDDITDEFLKFTQTLENTMGFSLEKFFADLQTLLEDTTMNAAKKIRAIKKLKLESEAYAKSCNAIPK